MLGRFGWVFSCGLRGFIKFWVIIDGNLFEIYLGIKAGGFTYIIVFMINFE